MTASSSVHDPDESGVHGREDPAAPALHLVSPTRATGAYERYLKRPFDIVVGGVTLVLLSPLLVAIAVAVRFRLGAPVIFRQRRIGRHGHEFDLLKFRTMGEDRRQRQTSYQGTERRVIHKARHDPRHTALGRRLRRMSLDELPQLVNVIRGDMSLVGPRPELAEIAREHSFVDHPRHDVRPGMTGFWQVSTDRAGMLYENADKDLEYIERITLWGDLKTLLRTPGALTNGR